MDDRFHVSLPPLPAQTHRRRQLTTRYLKTVDNFNNKLISAFLTAGSAFSSFGPFPLTYLDIKLCLLHETRNDDGIRAFFNDVWECYIKTLLNPFYAVDGTIKSPAFENKIKAIAKVWSFLCRLNAAILIDTCHSVGICLPLNLSVVLNSIHKIAGSLRGKGACRLCLVLGRGFCCQTFCG